MPPAATVVRLKRSRALWEQTRSDEGKWKNLYNILRAISYELQPIRYSQVTKFREVAATNLGTFGKHAKTTVPQFIRWTFEILNGMTKKQWLIVAFVIVYYVFIRWIHAVLEAGPVVLILTALVTMFTIGLNDEKSDGLSAYSVFNKGFQKIMGSIDEDSLLQQHIGGGVGLGFLAAAAAGHDRQPRNNDPAPSPRRRQQQQIPERREDDQNNGDPTQQQQQEENNRSRKSGKKTRRGNLEQRREMRRQREAALAMGFDGENDHVAMNRLLDDPVPIPMQD
jgi:hypothetical protein